MGDVLTQNMRFMIGLPCQRKNHFILLSFSNKYADTLRIEQYNINKSLTKAYGFNTKKLLFRVDALWMNSKYRNRESCCT